MLGFIIKTALKLLLGLGIVFALFLLFSCNASGQSVMEYPKFTVTVVDGDGWEVRIGDLTVMPNPPHVFRHYYNEVVECGAVDNPPPFETISWFSAAGIMEYAHGGIYQLWAVYFAPPPEIVLTSQDPAVVKHELYHYATGDMDDDAANVCARAE